MTYQQLVATDDLSLTVPTKLNENARTERFLNIAAKDADFTAWADDTTGSPRDLYLVTTGASPANIIATLPAISTADAVAGRVVTIMKADYGSGTTTLTPDGADEINGAASGAMATQYDYRTLVSDGTSEWFVISSS